MSLPRTSLFLVVVGVIGLFGLEAASQDKAKGPTAAGGGTGTVPKLVEPKLNPAKKTVSAASSAASEIIQEFPTNDAPKTAWKIQWATAKGHGLFIKEAWFRRTPGEPFIQVVGDIRLGEMFVPYHSGTPRFWDISYDFSLLKVGPAEAGPFGKVLGDPPNVVCELRDRGVMWVDPSRGVRRGQALVLWANLDAANYRYLIEYGFQDDGVLTCRVGSTGRNYASREFEGHMHHGMWRVDVNIDGPANNSVYVMEHLESAGEAPEKARTHSRLFNQGKEGFEDWKAENFTMLNVLNHNRKNIRGKPLSYDVVVPRTGAARHFGPDEEGCTQHDYWVTKNRPGELTYRKIPQYIKKGDSIVDTDVVLWIGNACHHEPRSEDGVMRGASLEGATPVAWSGFELRPRNFFDGTPHYNFAAPPAKKK
jgi:primary-amine oxidase